MDTIPQDTPQKQCSNCKQFFPATSDHFIRDRYQHSGFKSRCKACQSLYGKAQERRLKEARRSTPLPEGTKKFCSQCHQEFLAITEFFGRDRSTITGFKDRCKSCDKTYKRAQYLRLKEERKDFVPPPFLICTRCKCEKPFDQFQKSPTQRSGRANWCKECATKNNTLNSRKPEYKAKQRERDKKNRERKYIVSQKWRRENKDRVAAYSKASRRKNPEVFKSRWQRWAKTENGREHCRTRVRSRKARKKGAQGNYTHADVVKQRTGQHNRCYYCGDTLTKYHIDHIVPLSRGGSNNPDNLVLTCPTCNLKKNNKLPHEWPEGGRLL